VKADPADTGSPSIRLLQLTAVVSTLDRFAMPPMLVAIAVDLGAPLSAIVHAAGAYFLVYGLMQPVWGTVSDILGRVRTMRVTLLLAGLFTIASAFAWGPVSLGVLRGIAGGLFGAAYPSLLIYIGDTVPAAVRQRDIARLMVGVAIGTSAASVGAGALADTTSWRVAFVLTGVASLALAVLLRRLPEPRVHREAGASLLAPLRMVAGSRVALFVLAMAFTEGAVLLGALTLLPAAAEDAGSTAAVAGAVTGVYGISVFLGARLVGRLSQSWHPARLIALGAAAAVVSCATLTISRDPFAAVTAALLLGLAWTAMHSSLQTWATEVLPQARASIVSLFAGSLFVGSALAAVLVADLADAGRYDVIYLLGAGLAVPLGLSASWGRSRWHRPLDAS
jgi:predicted MFS family arabinose efflux permease